MLYDKRKSVSVATSKTRSKRREG